MKIHPLLRWSIALTLVVFAGMTVSLRAAVNLLTGSETFNTVTWGPADYSTDILEFSFTIENTGLTSDLQFLNIYDSVTSDWLVQNMPVGMNVGAQTFSVDVFTSVFGTGGSYATLLSDTAVASLGGGTPTYLSSPTTVTTDTRMYGLSGLSVNYQGNNAAGKAEGGAITSFVSRTPTIRLGFGGVFDTVYHVGMPSALQGVNECAPTSAANSLAWLDLINDNIALDLTPEEIRDILKGEDYMNTSAATGTTDDNFLKGKDQFVEDFDLPIDTHLVGGGAILKGRPEGLGESATMANIMEEMKKGQDVELSVLWAGGGGHWVTLTGVLRIGDDYGLSFIDPATGKSRFTWVTEDEKGFLHLEGYGANTVDTVFAESIIPEPAENALILFVFGALFVAYRQRRR